MTTQNTPAMSSNERRDVLTHMIDLWHKEVYDCMRRDKRTRNFSFGLIKDVRDDLYQMIEYDRLTHQLYLEQFMPAMSFLSTGCGESGATAFGGLHAGMTRILSR